MDLKLAVFVAIITNVQCQGDVKLESHMCEYMYVHVH